MEYITVNKIEFIAWLLNHYNVSDFAFENEMKKYNSGLIDSEFDLLKAHVEKHCKSKPLTTELNRIIKVNNFEKKVYLKSPALQHMIDLRKIPHVEMSDFPEDLKAKMTKVLSKYGISPNF